MKQTGRRVLRFTKRSGKDDQLEFWNGDEKVVQMKTPKQGPLPHDMIHYIIESIFPFEGFIALVFAGHQPGRVMEVLHGYTPVLPQEYSQASWVTESLVESLQASLWSKSSAFDDFEYVFGKACEARGIPASAIDESQFRRSLEMVERLTSSWSALPVGETLELEF